jgi:hypothetical protein
MGLPFTQGGSRLAPLPWAIVLLPLWGDGKANKPAAPNAGIASRLTIEHHWSGVGEPERYADGI